ncbi:MAG: EpsG family protein, partial [Sarcina sp.]
MEIYILFIIMLATIAVFKINKKSVDIVWWIIFCIGFIYIFYQAGLYSNDHHQYINYYVDTGLHLNIYDYEKGFKLLNKLLYGIFNNNFTAVFTIYYTIMGVFFTLGISYLVKLKRYYIFIVPLIFVNMLIPGACLVRQYMAIAICIFSLRFLFNKKYVRFVILVVLASFFHVTALAFLGIAIAYLVVTLKVKLKYKFIAAGVLGVIGIAILFIPYVQQKINTYLLDKSMDVEVGFGLVMALFLLINIALLVYVLWKKKHLQEYEKFILSMGILFFVIYLALMNFGFMNRIAYYLQLFMYMNMIDAINIFKNKYIRFSVYCVYFLVLIALT